MERGTGPGCGLEREQKRWREVLKDENNKAEKESEEMDRIKFNRRRKEWKIWNEGGMGGKIKQDTRT